MFPLSEFDRTIPGSLSEKLSELDLEPTHICLESICAKNLVSRRFDKETKAYHYKLSSFGEMLVKLVNLFVSGEVPLELMQIGLFSYNEFFSKLMDREIRLEEELPRIRQEVDKRFKEYQASISQ